MRFVLGDLWKWVWSGLVWYVSTHIIMTQESEERRGMSISFGKKQETSDGMKEGDWCFRRLFL